MPSLLANYSRRLPFKETGTSIWMVTEGREGVKAHALNIYLKRKPIDKYLFTDVLNSFSLRMNVMIVVVFLV